MSSRRPRRNGYVMVLVAMLLFGLFAMAALVIDLGFARVAQRQMQSAADSAAVEGLRFIDKDGRQRARDVVALSVDDDLDFADNHGPIGLGPIVEFEGSAGDANLNASPLMTIPELHFYRPSGALALQLNAGDGIAGDMLEGDYAFTPPTGSTLEERRTFHQENSGYARTDFPNPDPDGDLDPPTYPAFLVRVRRTDEVAVQGVRTSGPPLPYLFGRASLLRRETVGNGIQARGTSIAALQPVVCVGEPVTIPVIPGKLGFAVPLTEWETGSGTTFRVYESNAIGGEATMPGTPPSGEGYLAIYNVIEGANRVIGFGPALISTNDSTPVFSEVPPFEITNASATFCYPFAGTGVDDDLVFRSRFDNRDALFQLPVSGR